MLRLLKKTSSSLKTVGIKKTLIKIVNYPLRYPLGIIKQSRFRRYVLTLSKMEDRFTEIYKSNYWGAAGSVSGSGSTLAYTTKLRSRLPELFRVFSIKSIFDAPCGDFSWMKQVLEECDLTYVGGDIVRPLIESHNSHFKNHKTRFIHIDLTKETFPKCNLMICRDCLFHLSFQDAFLVLQNFVHSEINYILTSTHKNSNDFHNMDIATGDFRLIDLFAAPFHLPKSVHFRIDDWEEPNLEREMCLWTKAQVIQALALRQGRHEPG